MIGIVYKAEIGDKLYIGSTTEKLNTRQQKHNFKLKQNIGKTKLYEECRNHNITETICIPLEEKEIENKDEIRLLEQEYIDKLNPILNHIASYTGLSRKEYYETNKKKFKEQHKEYYETNKKKINEQHKQYRENNEEKRKEKVKCDICGIFISKTNISTHKKTKKCLQSECL